MNRALIGSALTLAILAAIAPVGAQDEMPAVGSMAEPAEQRAPIEQQAGTTIIGERESPIGLYIMPWREARPEADMDRPARLLQEDLQPLDEDVFVRQIEYHDALSDALKQKGLVTPGGR
ncbi:MAG: hypothetical protein AB1651_05560 [Pseudomonadota bacterium]